MQNLGVDVEPCGQVHPCNGFEKMGSQRGTPTVPHGKFSVKMWPSNFNDFQSSSLAFGFWAIFF